MPSKTIYVNEAMSLKEKYDHSLDFSDRLLDGEVISSAEWIADASLNPLNEMFSDNTATVWFEPSVIGKTVSELIVTSSLGRKYEVEFVLEICE